MTTTDLMGVGEVADVLGVTKQRVHQLAKEDAGFPQPLARLRATPVWDGAAIRSYSEVRGRLHRCPSCRCGAAS